MTTEAAPDADASYHFDDLTALFINCTLKPSPQLSHTQGLIDKSAEIMMARGSPHPRSVPSTTTSLPVSTRT